MKNSIASLVALFVSATALFAAPPAAQKGQIEVIYDHPENFTDVKDSDMGSEKGRDSYLALLKEHLQDRGSRYLAEGQKLTLTFTNIDMAGDFEPWRGMNYHDVRIVKEIYPPRMNFAYKLADATGAVVKEGQEKLIDMAFQLQANPINSSDSLRYEKAMLDNWLRDTFPKPKKADAKK
jgi:hypothetical protein